MKSTPQHQHASPNPAAARQGHDELNFAEFPLVLLATRAPAGLHSIEYQDDYTDATGKTVTRKVTINGAGKYGLPTAQDEDVLIALMYLTFLDKQKPGPAAGRTDQDPAAARTVYFTRPQLFQILGWSDTGDNYERLRKSLRRWKGVTIVYENWTVLTGDGERHRTDESGFSLLDNYELSDSRSRPREPQAPTLPFADLPAQRSLCSITWNQTPFASFNSGYLKTLDLDRYFRLPTAAAKRAFRYLDKNLPPAGTQEYDLERFSCQHVGFSPNYKPSRLRQDVEQTVVRPLEQANFIAPLPAEERFPKAEGRYRVVFARAGQASLAPPADAPPAESIHPAPFGPVLSELRRRGLGGKAARDLAAAHPAAYIEEKIEFLDYLLASGTVENPPAWLRRAIEEDYGPPAGYVSRAQRLNQQQAIEEKRRQKEAERAACRRQEEQESAARKAERAHIDAYLKTLTPSERESLEERALANADETLRGPAQQGGEFAAVFRRLAVDQEVLRVHPLAAPAA